MPSAQRAHCRAELARLLQTHEPASLALLEPLLDAFAGRERELERCVRRYFSRDAGDLRVALEAAGLSAPDAAALQLPHAAIGAFLRATLQAARGGRKLEAVRGATSASRSNQRDV